MLTRRPFLSVSLVLSRHTDLCLPRSVSVCLRCGPRPESWTDTRAASPMDISLALRVFHLRLAVRHPPLCYSHGSLHQSLHRVHRQVGGNYALDQRGVAAESAESIASLAARSGATGKRFPVVQINLALEGARLLSPSSRAVADGCGERSAGAERHLARTRY